MKRIRPEIPVLILSLSFVASGCGQRTTGEGGGDETETTDASTEGEGTDTGSGTAEEDTGSFLEDSGSSESGIDPLPNGETCNANEECESGHCFMTAVGSVCSECSSGQDCIDEGTGINCTFNGMFFECSDGAAGEMCEEPEQCMEGLFCSQVVNTGGIIPDKFCSECDTTADCDMPQVCNPTFVPDLNMPMGQNICVDPGSVALDQFCDFEGDGNLACESGVCSIADVMGFIMLGACGECDDDHPCPMGETCMPAMLDMGTFMVMGSRCG
jgi:hypothetical protein